MAVGTVNDIPHAAEGPVALPTLGRPKFFSGIGIAFWVGSALWASHALATAWPYVGLMPQWLLLVAMPGVLFRGFDLIVMHVAKRRVSGWRRFLARVAALGFGLPAAGAGWDALDAISMHRFERAMAPLVADLHSMHPSVCPAESGPTLAPEVIAYLDEASAVRANAELHFDAKRFVLTFQGRSMDIDGSTVFYDSVARAWRKTHNDNLGQTGELTALVQGLTACRFRLP